MRVLLIEDEAVLADDIAEGLREEGMAVDVAYTGSEGLEKAVVNSYDVLVLDRNLPAVPGDEILRQVVDAGSPTRVLLLTASGGIGQRVEGLSLGADDYLPKPFAFVELVARIRALARRPSSRTPPILRRAGIVLDPAHRTVTRNGRQIRITKKEIGVLELLLASDQKVVTTEDILERVWDENADPFTNAVRVTVARLRRKLGEPPVIQTVVGVGYRIGR